ncbi:MAG: excinuclease ABC subunit UvrA [Chlamydiota bacterium]|nr:excinuclease ABC subunit UvrA [Chlamydiota bacterium]
MSKFKYQLNPHKQKVKVNNRKIILKNIKVHNLKSVDLTLNTNELIVFTGVSGSGKSSLAFDTLFVEGQRRYIESLSTFARRQLGDMSKPDIEDASGVTPTISIEQKTAGKNPRSTVGTMTEVYDYLRVLFARIGTPFCPVSGEPVSPQSKERIIRTIQNLDSGTKLIILAPYARNKKAEFKEDFLDLQRKGYTRARVDGNFVSLMDEITLDGNVAHDVDIVIDRIKIEAQNNSRIAESIISALNLGKGVCITYIPDSEDEQLFSMHAFSQKSGLSYNSLEPQDFSFNSPAGMCPRCKGMGETNEFDLEILIDPNKSISKDCCSIASSYETVRYGNIYNNLARLYNFSVKTPWKKLPEEAKKVFLHGTEKKWTRMHFVHPLTGKRWVDNIRWQGVLYEAHRRYAEAKSERYRKKMQELMHIQQCPECNGSRLKPYPAAAKISDKTIADLTAMTVSECYRFFKELTLPSKENLIAEELLKEIKERLHFLEDVGLHYLTLNRTAPTLSGGEAQRVRLASQIGCGLVGITYILDEPSIGLHPRDNKKLIKTLKHLRDMGNTVVVVEHDEETIWAADRVVDFGPGAGTRGGEIIVNGNLETFLKNKKSVTARYLTGEEFIEIPKKRRKPSKKTIHLKGVTHHNLKNVSVKIPLGMLVCVTGVSGSGKSSLITDTLYPILANKLHKAEHKPGKHKSITGIDHIDKIIAIDQSPIGRNPRSNPSTYIKVFDDIRDLFTKLPESRARGYKSGRFSFNVKEGSCPQCNGMGLTKIDMDFMDDAWVDCTLCKTRRFDHETLSVYYKGKNIYDILEMEVEEARDFFTNIPSIHHKLETLCNVGMGYIKLGQSSTTLSGGEAQRIKLAKELVRPSTGNTLYIFDEPTTGLHFHDIEYLLNVFQKLIDKGNTVLVIEHNMDVVKTADWIIDIGPDGGAGGGEIVAEGPPEKVAQNKSPTGIAIFESLNHDPQAKVKEILARSNKKEAVSESITSITVTAAEQHNLKHIDACIPRGKLTICTGPSGSGKSSLAFDTIYAEGQRRYIESLSPYARQFVKQMPKPKVGFVGGLSPAIAIEQKAHAGNPRSTIGTMTEIYDYLRVLWARKGVPHCPETGEQIKAISKDYVVDRVLAYPENEKIQILAPVEMQKSDKFEDIISKLKRQGFVRIRLNGNFLDLDMPIEEMGFEKKRKNKLFLVIDRLKVNPTVKSRLFEAIENAAEIGKNKLIVMREDKDIAFNLSFAVESTGKSYREITPQTFAFNTQEGMCPECLGLGYQYGANLVHNADIMSHSIISLMHTLWGNKYSDEAVDLLMDFLDAEGIDPFCALSDLPKNQLQLLMNGSPQNTAYGKEGKLQFRWQGINLTLAKAGKSATSDIRQSVVPLLDEHNCISCKGSRINALARNVTINKRGIHELCDLPINETLKFIQKIKFTKEDAKLLDDVRTQLINRLNFLCEVGLQYIALSRKAPTLSGGEAQRIRLARQLGSGLTGVLYVLDEPTIGLHPRDNDRLNRALKQLKDLGNTMLMVEHDPLTIATADYILDFGPNAGENGGHITAKGTYKQILRSANSLTGAYLSNKKTIATKSKKRVPSKKFLKVKNATKHNLKNISVDIPVGLYTCITGVSGSGKSTLLEDVILPSIKRGLHQRDRVQYEGATISGIKNFDRLINIDQNPIGHTVRANVGTYVEVLPRMRDFFAALPDSKVRGLQGKHFSFNHRSGMCTACWGLGYKRVEMHFLPTVKVVCDDCMGLRLNPLSLEVKYKDKNFGEYLQCTVKEARLYFENHPRITRILDTLIDVGLGYLKLGQEVATLSGGEAQRIKLSRELAKRSTGKTLYLLDEPTTGLHSDDINKLLQVLNKLVDKGNTMVIIEHNVDMMKNADYLIDLGPDAGEFGGEVVYSGKPEDISTCKESFTAKYLEI